MRAKLGTKGASRRERLLATAVLPAPAPAPQLNATPDRQSTHNELVKLGSVFEPLLTDFDLAEITGRARSTWQKARLLGTGPPFIRLGRLVRYRAADVEAWLSAHPALRSTSEAG